MTTGTPPSWRILVASYRKTGSRRETARIHGTTVYFVKKAVQRSVRAEIAAETLRKRQQ